MTDRHEVLFSADDIADLKTDGLTITFVPVPGQHVTTPSASLVTLTQGEDTLVSDAVVPSGDYLPLVKIAPDYPPGARQKGISGYCVIEYTVSKTGAVLDPQVVEGACEHARFFAEPSMEAAKQFKYTPHLIDGEAVEVEGVQNKFTYELLP